MPKEERRNSLRMIQRKDKMNKYPKVRNSNQLETSLRNSFSIGSEMTSIRLLKNIMEKKDLKCLTMML
jgi:hypothetical protein